MSRIGEYLRIKKRKARKNVYKTICESKEKNEKKC